VRRNSSTAAALAVALALAACQPASAPEATAADGSPPPSFDAGIEAAYLTQGVQDRAGSVPLVEGRPGLLRIFLRARSGDVPAPAVRVALVETGTGDVVRTWLATSPLAYVPTGVFEDARGGSWNVDVPGDVLRAGRHLVVELGAIPGIAPERLRGTARLPAAGSLDVRPGHVLPVLLVPVIQSGLRPDVDTTRTAESWLELARVAHPVVGVDLAVAAPYTTGIALRADGGGWSELLGELDRKRVADGSPRLYLGAVRISYASGTAGRGLNDGRVALASDVAGFYARIAAHELGHNLGLLHAPCGTSDLASIDPTWPEDPAHEGAHIGVFGWDPRSGAVKDPAATFDLMSYCGGEDTTWASDHGYRLALDALAASAAAAASTSLAAGPASRQACVLVSGQVVEGRVELGPVHALDTVPSMPSSGGGEYELDLLGGGSVLATVAFDPRFAPAEEGAGEGSGHFAMAIPLAPAARERVDGVVVRRRGAVVATRTAAPSGAPAVRTVRDGDGGVRVEWDHRLRPEVMIRDPATGEILAFARGGAARLPAGADLELRFSDGVRSDPPLRVRTR
jgi:hypothetical protein